MRWTFRVGVVVLGVMLMGNDALAAWHDDLEVGARAGEDVAERVEFEQYEVFAHYPLKWKWDLWHHMVLSTRLDAALGWLNVKGKEGIVGALGPGFILQHSDSRIRFEAGINVTLLGEDEFERHNFGGPLQATSYLAASLRLYRGSRVSYRLHHISNGGIYDPNPGLDVHLLGLSYAF